MSPALPRAALAFALLAALLPAQYLSVRTSGSSTPSGVFMQYVSLEDVDGNGVPEAFLQTCCQLFMIPDVWNATPAQINAPVLVANCSAHAFANVNGDGFRDLVLLVQYGTGQSLAVMIATGPGAFAPPVTVIPNLYPLGGSYSGPNQVGLPLVAADFNGDGLDDAAIFGNNASGVAINLGTTWFVTWSSPSPPSAGGRVGDFNGDGFKDVVLSSSSAQTMTWYGPWFSGAVTLPAPPGTTYGQLIAAGDVDGDGYDDAVVWGAPIAGGTGPIGVWVQYGGPGGLAYVPQSALIGAGPVILPFPATACRIVDLDADGNKDIVGIDVSLNPASLAVARGLGGRNFFCRIDGQPWAAPNLSGLVPYFADLDGDGDADAFSLANSLTYYYVTQHQVLENRATVATGCAGAGGIPAFPVGTPFWGNPAFTLGLSGAAPLAPAALIVSTQSSAAPGCGPGPSLLPENLVLPSGSLGLFTTTASGAASLSTPIPPIPALASVRVFAQWAVNDPAGAYAALGTSFALTATRTICVH